jgi:hypothetical protein
MYWMTQIVSTSAELVVNTVPGVSVGILVA